MVMAVIASLLAVVGYAITWVTSPDKMKPSSPLPYLLAFGAVATAALILWQHSEQEADLAASQRQLAKLQGELTGAREEFADARGEFQSQLVALRGDYAEAQAKLEPVLDAAKAKHPSLGDEEALARFLAEALARREKLEFVKQKTKKWQDEQTKKHHALYHFRPKYPVTLRDVVVDMKFDGVMEELKASLVRTLPYKGNIEVEINSPSPLGIRATAKQMDPGGELILEVISGFELNPTSCSTKP